MPKHEEGIVNALCVVLFGFNSSVYFIAPVPRWALIVVAVAVAVLLLFLICIIRCCCGKKKPKKKEKVGLLTFSGSTTASLVRSAFSCPLQLS